MIGRRTGVLLGALLVSIAVPGAPVSAGPSLPAPTFVRAWGSTGGGDGEFRDVQAIAADPSGNLYVCDAQNDRIQKFDATGTLLGKWTTCPEERCGYAPDVAVDPSGNVFVLQSTYHRAHKFTSSGTYVTSWDAALGVAFRFPNAIAVDPIGRVYVGDWNRVIVFSGFGTFLDEWPVNAGVVSSMAVGPDGTVYVASHETYDVQAYAPDGTFLRRWGSAGTGDGQFSDPQGIAVRADGYVFVADTYNDRIQVFTSEGLFVGKWGVSGTAPGQFDTPTGIAFVGESIFVTDSFSRVQEFATSAVPALGTSWGKLKAAYR